jgi:hypothetical protein
VAMILDAGEKGQVLRLKVDSMLCISGKKLGFWDSKGSGMTIDEDEKLPPNVREYRTVSESGWASDIKLFSEEKLPRLNDGVPVRSWIVIVVRADMRAVDWKFVVDLKDSASTSDVYSNELTGEGVSVEIWDVIVGRTDVKLVNSSNSIEVVVSTDLASISDVESNEMIGKDVSSRVWDVIPKRTDV